MHQCSRCQGFVPDSASNCPNCRSTKKWWAFPLAVLGASAASVTLSACYGMPCTASLPDGGSSCGLDCGALLADGGTMGKDPIWANECAIDYGTDAGTDAGADAGRDGGP